LAAGGLVVLLLVFPPFHVVSLRPIGGERASSASAAEFDEVNFARQFWESRLLPACGKASDLGPLLNDLRRDPGAAAKHHGRQAGIGGPAYYFVRGTGRVVAVEKSRVVVAVDGAEGTVALRTGPVFGNVIRDGTGLLEVNSVPGLAEFNSISAELNRLVEAKVQPALKNLSVGETLRFAGCAEAPENVGDGPLLVIVPVQAEAKP
jgi:predicted lipoprotein